MSVDKPACKYGKKCYRKNPTHFEEFSHPGICVISIYGKCNPPRNYLAVLERSEFMCEEMPIAKRPKMMSPNVITLDDDLESEVVVKEKKKADPPIKPLSGVACSSGDQSTLSTPIFHLTKVFGLSSRYNGCDMALGIKGLFLI